MSTPASQPLPQIRSLAANGRLAEAEQACRARIAAQGGERETLVLLARILREHRGADAALRWFATELESRPDAGLLVEYGNHLQQARRVEESLANYRRAVALEPELVEAELGLGVALQSLARLEEAVDVYRSAIRKAPQAPLLHFNIGTAFKRLHRFGEALDAYRRAVELAPGMLPALNALGTILVEQGVFDEAAEVLARAERLAPDDLRVLHMLAYANLKLARGEEAVRVVSRLVELQPEDPGRRVALSSALLVAGRPAEALAACDAGLALLPGDTQAIANRAIALVELGRTEEAESLLDVTRFLRECTIETPPGFASLADFNAALLEHVRTHPTLNRDCNALSCHNGRTSDELLVEPKGPVALLERAIERAVTDYLGALAGGPPHPFVSARPPKLHSSAWVTQLRSQGQQYGHVHPSAWLSGVYYVSLPPEMRTDVASDAGWIEFGAPPRHYVRRQHHPVRCVQPREGLMVLFPSYLYHRTLPFESDAERVTIAFDLRDRPA